MSPASYLTAPPRDAAYRIALSVSLVESVSFSFMVFWISLAILVVALVAGIAFCALRGLQLYRTAKRSGGTITAGLHPSKPAPPPTQRPQTKAPAGPGPPSRATPRPRGGRGP